MAASENLRRELESIEGGIEELQEALFEVESLRAAGVRPGWLRALGVRMLRVDLRRRMRDLEGRRRVVNACLVETRRYEGRPRPAERERAVP